MDWIFDHFQILALVGLALASWLKSRADAKASEREDQEARRKLEDPEELFGPGEAWRGPYKEPASPPPMPPPLVCAAPPLLPAVEVQGELKRQIDMQQRLRQIRETKSAIGGATAAAHARAKDIKSTKTISVAPVGLRAALRNHGQVRRAIVMREILGPPLGLR